jgi:2-octaprenylphenol hydroxylase
VQNQYDIIIIGCGLVGGSLAVSLPQNLSIAIIDAQSPMTQQPGFLALNRLSSHILKRLDVWDDIVAYEKDSATPIKKIAVSEEGDASTERLMLHAEDIGAPALGYVTSTTAIRGSLYPKIQAQKNITLFCPNRAETIEWPNEGIEFVTVNLAEINQTLKAKLLIIADGGRSSLREQLGFETHTKDTGHHIFITQLKGNKPHYNQAFERFTSHGPIALLPTKQDEYVLVWTMKQTVITSFLEQNEKSLFIALQEAYGEKDFNEWTELGPRRTYPIICSYVKDPIKTRVVLMGNAAHTVHPVGAQGFNLSLKDALVLNELIQDASEQQQDIGSEQLLENYISKREEDTEFVLYFTQSLLNVFSWEFPFLTEARSHVMDWLNQSSFLKQSILEKTAGLPNLPLKKKKLATSPSSLSYDIIILGNRLVGSTLACALNPRYRIAILDKAPTPSLHVFSGDEFQLRINAYNRSSEALLKAIGVWEKLPEERLFAFDKIFATHEQNDLSFSSNTIGEPHLGHFIENDLVTYFLHQRIKELPHIDFIDDASVESIHPSSDHIHVKTQDGRVFSAKLLAACDGANSVTRQLLNLPLSHHPYYQRCIVANIFFEGNLHNTAWQNFLKTGPIGLLPLRDGVCSLAWSCDNAEAQRLLTLQDDMFTAELNHVTLGCLGKITHVSARQSFPLTAQHVQHYYAERTILLGDAAHTIHPLGGLGANLGFQDVLAAASLLNDKRIGSRDIGRRYLLEKYETMRKSHNARVMDTMTAFNAMFHQTHPVLNPLGRLSLNIANKIVPIKNKLFKEAMWMGMTKDKIREIVKNS